jgi:hypothetical protein
VFRPGFEPGTSRIQIGSVAASASLLGGENNIKMCLKETGYEDIKWN